jgi:hypothetical protein
MSSSFGDGPHAADANAASRDEQREYALFRRAICDGDNTAWNVLVEHYHDTVRAWVRTSRSYRDTGDEEMLVSEAFERFWFALRPERFVAFPSMKYLLGYLRSCANTCVLDHTRSRFRRPHLSLDCLLETTGYEGPGSANSVEDDVSSTQAACQLWSRIEEALLDPHDRLLVLLSVVAGFTPATIQAKHPDIYPSVADVYQRKQRIKGRLRRLANVDAARA